MHAVALAGQFPIKLTRALTEKEQAAIDRIFSHPFTQVRKKLLMESEMDSTWIPEAIEEFRKFLALVALGYNDIGMVSETVDEVWHTFILFTRDYTQFCNEVYGFYLHHIPNLDKNVVSNSGANFRTAYQEVFGSIPTIWNMSDEQCSGTTNCQEAPSGCSASNCNPWGGSEGE